MEACKILIVEDESLVAMDMVDMLTRLGYELLPNAMGYQEAIAAIENNRPDLVLLDINLSGVNTGIDIARLLNNVYGIPFVFITSHSDRLTVSAAAETLPCGYLVKPFDSEDLFTSVEVALASFSGRGTGFTKPGNALAGLRIEDSVFVKTDKNFVKVKINDILWLEAEHNYMFIVTDKGKYVVRSSFRDFLQNIESENFFQVHKSFIINLNKIESFSHTEVIINGKELPLSRNCKEAFFTRINRIA